MTPSPLIADAAQRLADAIVAATDPADSIKLLADLALLVSLAQRAEVLLGRVCAG